MKKILKEKNAITLIALVITIVVLVILAGVIIALSIGENGLIKRSQLAAEESNRQSATDTMNLKITNVEMTTYAEKQRMPTLKELADKFCEDDDFQYVQEASQVASLEKINSENPTSIFTKLKKYPYEFEINDSLQLASINGVKVATNTDTIEVKDVGNVTVTITDVLAKEFKINVIPEDESKIALYQYYVNDELIYEGVEKTYIAKKLNMNTEYNVEVKVVPKTLVSVSRLKQKTNEAPVIEIAEKFDRYIYIDSVNGDNTNGNGTKSNPYKTLDKIADSGIITTGYSYGIVLKSGTYDLTTRIFNLSCNKSINLIGNRQNTIVRVNGGLYPNSHGGTSNYSVNLYRLIWDGCNTYTHNEVCVYNNLNYYSVVFKNLATDGWTSYYEVFKGVSLKFYNCTDSQSTTAMLRPDGGTIQLTNCYGGFTSGYQTQDNAWNYQTNYITSSPQLNTTTYEITDTNTSIWKNVGTGENSDGTQANLGVYGGEYSWDFEDDIFMQM